jgi:hypothetical protein
MRHDIKTSLNLDKRKKHTQTAKKEKQNKRNDGMKSEERIKTIRSNKE